MMSSEHFNASGKSIWVNKAQAKIEQLDARIRLLQAKARESGAETQEYIQEQLDALEKMKSDLSGKATEIEEAGAEAWKNMKLGLESAMQDLSTAIDRAMTRYR
jgi:dsDNA-specific endonuclease/ATPase MutS2